MHDEMSVQTVVVFNDIVAFKNSYLFIREARFLKIFIVETLRVFGS